MLADPQVADAFARVLGPGRHATPAHVVVRDGHPGRSASELRRLMGLAVHGAFDEPLACVRALAGQLGGEPPSPADVLAMCLGTWLAHHAQDGAYERLAAAHHPGGQADAFAAGLRSRVAQRLETSILDCPPGDPLRWARQRTAAALPAALADMLATRPGAARAVGSDAGPMLAA